LLLPELAYQNKRGMIDRLTLVCLCLLWCKESDAEFNNSPKDEAFKELTRTNSIKFMLEKLVRISTILVYGRLKDFGFNANTFLIDHEFEILNRSIKDLVETVYIKLQVDEEEMEQAELEKKIRIPRYLYDSGELRKKLNQLAFSPDKV
jgi:hypothetical protein